MSVPPVPVVTASEQPSLRAALFGRKMTDGSATAMANRASPVAKPRIAGGKTAHRRVAKPRIAGWQNRASPNALNRDRRAFEAAGHDLYRSSSGRSGAAFIMFSLQACS